MKERIIIGVDVSKSTLDIFLKPVGLATKIANDVSGFKKMLKELNIVQDQYPHLLVVMEHTGKYSYRFESFLRSREIDYCKIPALEIKRSLGLTRGKNDKIDARRIAEYAWLRRDILTAAPAVAEQIRELKELLSLRSKLVKDRSGYISRLKEMKACGTCTQSDYLGKMHKKLIDAFTRDIGQLEGRITGLIKAHRDLEKTCQLLRSIKGIGWIVAAYMIACTENFTRFSSARKFNCYAGLAPFEYTSGTSIRGKSRVSHLANKTAKTLLNLAASSAIQWDAEMKAYYRRRVAEGKKKMSCLNIIRTKLVARMFAIVKRQTPYQPTLVAA